MSTATTKATKLISIKIKNGEEYIIYRMIFNDAVENLTSENLFLHNNSLIIGKCIKRQNNKYECIKLDIRKFKDIFNSVFDHILSDNNCKDILSKNFDIFNNQIKDASTDKKLGYFSKNISNISLDNMLKIAVLRCIFLGFSSYNGCIINNEYLLFDLIKQIVYNNDECSFIKNCPSFELIDDYLRCINKLFNQFINLLRQYIYVDDFNKAYNEIDNEIKHDNNPEKLANLFNNIKTQTFLRFMY